MRRAPKFSSSDDSVVEPPVLIPNTAVKHDSGDDSRKAKITHCSIFWNLSHYSSWIVFLILVVTLRAKFITQIVAISQLDCYVCIIGVGNLKLWINDT